MSSKQILDYYQNLK